MARGIPTLLRQPKCHPPCEECCLPLEDQPHPEEIPLAPGEARREGFCSDEDPQSRERIRHVDKGVVGRKARSMLESGWTGEDPSKVKGEFVEN